jgi:SAM-dependent methyltransferase
MGVSFYDDAYFAWQRAVGEFGGTANLPKFARFVAPTDTVLDFGCGGGYTLARLSCAKRIGVDVNAHALSEARRQGIEVIPLESVPSGSVDLVISDNALEHLECPIDAVKSFFRVLKPGQRAVVVVPCESILMGDRGPDDRDQHLHSWSPGALANLFRTAGFEVIESKPYIHRWPPKCVALQRLLGWRLFHLACRLWGSLSWTMMQVRIVARKPA